VCTPTSRRTSISGADQHAPGDADRSATDDSTVQRMRAHPVVARTVVCSARNRAQRLNAGVIHATGEVVLIHHPATLLPPECALRDAFSLMHSATASVPSSTSASAMKSLLSSSPTCPSSPPSSSSWTPSSPPHSSSWSSSSPTSTRESPAQHSVSSPASSAPRWGCFRHRFDHAHWLLRFTSWYSNWARVGSQHITYFDHCPFTTRQLLLQVPVPDMDIFEE
jgi:hypothetical protein